MIHPRELARDKHEAQKELARMAEENGLSYCAFVHQYAKEVYKKWGYTPKIAKLKGSEDTINRKALNELLNK